MQMRNEAGWFLPGTGFGANVYMIRVFMESVRTLVYHQGFAGFSNKTKLLAIFKDKLK
jgi:hypothetical protein